MTPMWINEGSRGKRDFAERRLAALAYEVRQHEDTGREDTGRGPGRGRARATQSTRPHDDRLYKRLRELCGVRLVR